MRWSIFMVLVVVELSLAARAPIDVTDEPLPSRYQKDANTKIRRNVVGQIRRTTPRVCSETCDTTEGCIGFTYNLGNNKCEMLSHNMFTVYLADDILDSPGIDMYSKKGQNLYCPNNPNTIRDTFRPRCYQYFSEPKTWGQAIFNCRKSGGNLLLVPDQATYYSIWNQLQPLIDSGDTWIGMYYKRKAFKWLRRGQEAEFIYNTKLRRQVSQMTGPKQCGVLYDDGTIDVTGCTTKRPFVCEYRLRDDNEINQMCPADTVAYGDNCFWTVEGASETSQNSNAECVNRGGKLAALPSEGSMGFINHMWNAEMGAQITEAWVGLSSKNNVWEWDWDNEPADIEADLWQGGVVPTGSEINVCAAVQKTPQGLKYIARDCGQDNNIMCVGLGGKVKTSECGTKQCPPNSNCVEGHMKATCQCRPGTVSSHGKNGLECRESAICQASGDPHYTTWDGEKVHYQGLCGHILTETCQNATLPSGVAPFSVRVNNVRLPGKSQRVSFTQAAEVHVYGRVINMNSDNVVTLDGVERSGAFTIYPNNDEKYIEVTVRNKKRICSTDFGLNVMMANMMANVQAPKEYMDNMCGLCGNWNGDKTDDELTHQQASQFQLAIDQRRAECESDNNPPVCPAGQQAYAEERCNLIKTTSPLTPCRDAPNTSLAGFSDDCLEDSCAGSEGEVDQQLCLTMEAVIDYCKDRGFVVDSAWRQHTGCPMDCEANETYNPMMSLDVPTCQNPEANYEVSLGTGEGCECNEGFILDNDVCIDINNCGCLIEGESTEDSIYIEKGESYMNPTCTVYTECKGFGSTEVTNQACGTNAECVVNEQNQRACACKGGFTGDPLDECHGNDDCPYPMPGDPDFPVQIVNGPSSRQQPRKGALEHSILLSNARSVNNAEQHSSHLRSLKTLPLPIVYMPPGSHLTNPNCQIVDCLTGQTFTESEVICGENAECARAANGFYGCECPEGYSGDPLVRCDPSDCTYQFPGASSPTTISNGQSSLDENCNPMVCKDGSFENTESSGCGQHAECTEVDVVTFRCDCQTGYVKDQSGDCIEDSSGTGDPHFMVTSHESGDRLCFDAHGKNDDVLKMIQDSTLDLAVNGILFETNNSTPERRLSYFKAIAIMTGKETIVLDRDVVNIDNYTKFNWEDHFNAEKKSTGLEIKTINKYVVQISFKNVTLQVSRVKSSDVGYYLGVFVIHSDGFSSHCGGVIGQFIKTSFRVSHVNHRNEETGTLIFDNHPLSLPVKMHSRFNYAHHGVVDCWFYTTEHGDDDLLGLRADYTVPYLTYKPF